MLSCTWRPPHLLLLCSPLGPGHHTGEGCTKELLPLELLSRLSPALKTPQPLPSSQLGPPYRKAESSSPCWACANGWPAEATSKHHQTLMVSYAAVANQCTAPKVSWTALLSPLPHSWGCSEKRELARKGSGDSSLRVPLVGADRTIPPLPPGPLIFTQSTHSISTIKTIKVPSSPSFL